MSVASPIAVVGAGAWGSALARLLAQGGSRVALLTRRTERAEEIADRVARGDLPPSIAATTDARGIADAPTWVLAVPVAAADTALASLAHHRPKLIVNGAKGFVDGALRSVADLARARFDAHVVTLSGPNLSEEIEAGLPTAAVAAGDDPASVAKAVALFGQPRFRVYPSSDPRGVEVLGGAKNVIAIAAGMSDGLGLGTNAKAALVTRGLAELTRIAVAAGGLERTCFGLAGLGDLVATCAGTTSRNHRAGVALARGVAATDIPGTREGIGAVAHVTAFASARRIDAPIAMEVAAVVRGVRSADAALATLLARPAREE
jgi:glycerol-3-phosphate dehydrogenase (NAD(P)+)